MTFAKATLHCKTFNAKIASKTSCVQDFLRPRGSFAWLATQHGHLQYASDEKLYDLTSDPAPKHKVVCELESESSYMCEKSRAHIAVYANTATLSQAKEQCRRLGGRLPAGGDEVDCLNHALTTMRGGSPAKGNKPWVEKYDEQPLNVASPSYTLHDSKERAKWHVARQMHTVACAFNLTSFFDASPTIPGIRCPYHPSTIIKYFPVDMTFAKATLHCKTFNAKIASKTSCVQDFLRPRGSFAWLASQHGHLQYASDEKLYDLTSDPAPKHKVVCELESESSYMCEKSRAHIAVYANTATLSQAKEQCRRLGGRLPAGGDEVDCLNHALTTMRGGSPAKGNKPWVEKYDEQPLNVASPSYTLHDSKERAKWHVARQMHTVACAFNLSKSTTCVHQNFSF
ncbi:uncharacterized protein LOC135829940 [Sycon ciliatum]|uniref:uncharacterized protein LOC135829940 n=1 Tax=Sycon ciliatum TaxID=27933 RepID=UPI0031F714AA